MKNASGGIGITVTGSDSIPASTNAFNGVALTASGWRRCESLL
jgi:hypothetical protein